MREAGTDCPDSNGCLVPGNIRGQVEQDQLDLVEDVPDHDKGVGLNEF